MPRQTGIYRLLIIAVFAMFSNHLPGQMTINSAVTANQMIQSLIGQGIAVSNVQLNCAQGSYGTFNNGNTTNLGINNGILLTTGNADTAASANATSGFDVSICVGTTLNDPDLIAIDPTANNDVCILEFDLIPKCDSLTIRFVFGSEEYPNFVGSINDLFGFFVTGPNPYGPAFNSQNFAVIPGNIPVTINNINNGNANAGPCQNCAFYIDNSTGTTVQYDGMTVVITAGIPMVACQSYHFKIAIADASDCALDSGVFIDFLSCVTGFTTTTANTDDVCGSCTGTATVTVNGGSGPFTYQWLPTGGNAATATGLCAGTYSCLVTDQNSCGIPDTIVVTVGNNGSVTSTVQQIDATCFGDCNASLSLTPQSGNAPFTYVWTPNVSATNSATGLCAGQYVVQITDATGCSSTATYVITQPTAVSVSVTGNNTICGGGSTTLTANPAGGTGPYTITWDNSLPNGLTQTISPLVTTTYNATVTDANGCNMTQSFVVTVAPQPTAAFTAGQGDCAPAIVTFTDNSVGATTYVWDFGDPGSGPLNSSSQASPSHTYTSSGTYNVTLIVSNAGGCSDTIVIPNAVTVSAQPVAGLSATPAVVSELYPEVGFNDLSVGGTDCWLYFGDGDSVNTCNFGTLTHIYPAAGTYVAMYVVTNADGCTDTTYVTIVVEEQSTVYVPNTFTPNGSGTNDIFFAYGTNVMEFEMLI
ncbi:MAG TPA: choice-of-anchor L domain-containing protein, partial [Bacteroidia bacterium]|nr:choice-of-anchor L domain-containing protein [Bacteroidia bacterium]